MPTRASTHYCRNLPPRWTQIKACFFLLGATLFLCCAPPKTIGHFNPNRLEFLAPSIGCKITLPHIPDWQIIPKTGEDGVVFEAFQASRLLYMFLVAESLNAEIEDYYLIVRTVNRLDHLDGYKMIGKASQTINGYNAIRYIYSAKIESRELGTQEFTFTNALFKNKKMNYRLVIYTLSEAYERKQEIIDKIIQGFRLTEGGPF